MLELFVPGLPVTQGSMRAIPLKNGGAALAQGSSNKHRQALEDWRRAIRTAASAQVGPEYPLVGPIAFSATFGLAKPAYKPKRKRSWPISARSGDVDKLLRAVLDALTGVVWLDDSQVTSAVIRKDWSPRPGVLLRVEEDWLPPIESDATTVVGRTVADHAL